MSATRIPRGPGYSESVRAAAMKLFKAHATHETKKLHTMFVDFADETPPVPESMIADVLNQYLSDPASAGFGIGYVKAVIMGRYKQWKDQNPSGPTAPPRTII